MRLTPYKNTKRAYKHINIISTVSIKILIVIIYDWVLESSFLYILIWTLGVQLLFRWFIFTQSTNFIVSVLGIIENGGNCKGESHLPTVLCPGGVSVQIVARVKQSMIIFSTVPIKVLIHKYFLCKIICLQS